MMAQKDNILIEMAKVFYKWNGNFHSNRLDQLEKVEYTVHVPPKVVR